MSEENCNIIAISEANANLYAITFNTCNLIEVVENNCNHLKLFAVLIKTQKKPCEMIGVPRGRFLYIKNSVS